jgi:DNA repair exonuclease SbcCD ATPase subunit
MRVLSIKLSGFRGFTQTQRLDLNADAIVVIGANGHGKTSLFDGILWALSGRIPRLHNDNGRSNDVPDTLLVSNSVYRNLQR